MVKVVKMDQRGDDFGFLTSQFSEKGNLEKHDVDYNMAVNLGNVPALNMTFQSEEEAYEFYNSYAKAAGFSIRRHNKYTTKKDKKLIWRIFCCSCQGTCEKHPSGTTSKPRPQTRFDCEAQMKIELGKDSENFVVTMLIEQHSHELAAPDKAHMLRSHRRVRSTQKGLTDGRIHGSIGVPKIHRRYNKEVGDCNKLDFAQVDCDSIMQKRRTEFLKKGDGQFLLDYFEWKQKENNLFYYNIQFDDSNRIRNFFWCDAKSRADYEIFGDVVCFDTTYKTNEHDIPFAPFVGVNHHMQPILFASTLLSDETTETFVWVLETFLNVMGGKVMKTIFTGQEMAIVSAVDYVLPNTHHRLCIRHIYQNILWNLPHMFTKCTSFDDDFRRCIYEGEDEEEFLTNWTKLLENYNLNEDKWLQGLFQTQEKWAQVYSRDQFCAGMFFLFSFFFFLFGNSDSHIFRTLIIAVIDMPGMASIQRNEKMTKYFEKYFKREQNLRKFMNQFDKTLSLRRLKEANADINSSQSTPNLISQWDVERFAANFYTRKMFNRFQEEFSGILDLGAKDPPNDGNNTAITYDVVSYEGGKVHKVEFVSSNNRVKCPCKKFEFTGVLCAHMLKVLRMRNITDVPSQYFLKRWSKNANADLRELTKMAQTLVDVGSTTALLTEVAKRGLKRVIDELETCRKTLPRT
ncbi:hypothetical protein ACHQM5_006671 [Ranunculus cassubicifolius]